jgi:hypothetical protein
MDTLKQRAGFPTAESGASASPSGQSSEGEPSFTGASTPPTAESGLKIKMSGDSPSGQSIQVGESVKIHWGGKVFEFDSAETALKWGFHLQ